MNSIQVFAHLFLTNDARTVLVYEEHLKVFKFITNELTSTNYSLDCQNESSKK